ncbi:MAG: recombinase XerC [Robiginitomaculum sp.]|nr:MAG: recombinase XerC [Robiginitomaculum sp.]
MVELNAKNERLKIAYAVFMDEYDGLAQSTIDGRLAALCRYEEATRFVDFTSFNRERARAFKIALLKTGLVSATKLSTMNQVKAFFQWLANEGHLKTVAQKRAIGLLRLSRKDTRAGQASRPKKFASIAEFKQIIANMPNKTPTERRNRALIAFTALSGARDGAIITMQVKHIDFDKREIMQHPDEVNTKNSKLIVTWFFTVGEEIENAVRDYVIYLREELGFCDDDPLFPKTRMGQDENDCFVWEGLTKEHWANAGPVRKIFKQAFTAAGLTYRSPHRIRNTLMAQAFDLGLSGRELKAWSQNLGHEHLLTSLNSYAKLSHEEQRRAILGISEKTDDKNRPATLAEIKALLVAKGL